MDTSDYTGEPYPDAVAHVMDPAIASVAEAVLRDADLRIDLDSALESLRGHEAALEPFLASISSIVEPVQAQLDNLAATAGQGLLVLDSGISLGVDLPALMASRGLDDAWFTRIADVTGLRVDESVYQDLIDAVNQAFTVVDGLGPLGGLPDVPGGVAEVRAALNDVDLGELGDAGRAFAVREGRGLSWEAKKRLFLWFVGATLLCALVQAMVASEAAKELLEDGSTALTYVMPALAAASVGWDRLMPRPEEADEDAETES